MRNIKAKKLLREFKNSLYVNNELKIVLREGYIDQKTTAYKAQTKLSLVIALVSFLFIFSLAALTYHLPVNVESLRVQQYTSFAEIGGGRNVSISAYKDIAYINVYGQGIFEYSDKGLSEIYAGHVNAINVPKDGKRMLFRYNPRQAVVAAVI